MIEPPLACSSLCECQPTGNMQTTGRHLPGSPAGKQTCLVKKMAIALAASKDHMATVFESADSFVIIEAGAPEIQKAEPLPSDLSTAQLIKIMHELKVSVLLCGAISIYGRQMIEAADILVIPFLKGGVKDIAAGFFASRLDDPSFYLPGSRRGWQRVTAGKGWETIGEGAEKPRRKQKGSKQ